MTYTIPPDSPKAAKAAAFGRELVKALRSRGVSMNEVGRAAGVGATALDHYRTGSILPRTATGIALAEALDWPKLRTLIVEARTFTCDRAGCDRTFRNEAGGRKAYCSPTCQKIAANVRMASRRARQAGQTGNGRRSAQEVMRLRSGLRIADERNGVLSDAIAAMCRGCEPEGACRTPECPLRPFSPLPLAGRPVRFARPNVVVQREAYTPEKREKIAAGSRRRWARPGERERQAEQSRAMHAARTPEEREAWRGKVGLAAMSPQRRAEVHARSVASRKSARADA